MAHLAFAELETMDGEKKALEEVEGAVENHHKRPPNMTIATQLFAAFTAGMLCLSVGLNLALSSSLIPLIQKDPDLVSAFEDASWLASIFLIIGIPSSILGGVVSDKFGRRKTGLITCIPLAIGYVVQATANSYSIILVGRGIVSLAVWISYPSACVIVSEVVHPSIRGSLGVCTSIMYSIGMFASYLLGYLLEDWRTLCWVQLVLPILIFLTMLFIKETPYWLIQHGFKEEGMKSMKWYRGPHYDATDEISQMMKKKTESSHRSGFREKIKTIFSLTFLKALSSSGILFFFTQFTGISILGIYMLSMFKGLSLSFDPRLAPAIVGATRIVFATFASIALRRGNRKYIYCGSTVIIGSCALILALLEIFRSKDENEPWILGFLPFPIILVMFMAHSFGINTLLHVITTEVFPTQVRSLGNGVTLCLVSTAKAITAVIYPYALTSIGSAGCYFWFSGASLFCVIYAYCVIPDNRGKTLSTIEDEMAVKRRKKCQGIFSNLADKP